jgi:hypothetical protein
MFRYVHAAMGFVLIGGLVTGCQTTQTEIPSCTTAADHPVITLLSHGPGGATNLAAQPDCDPVQPGKAIVRMSWTPASPPGIEQRIAVTIFQDGFDRGEFDLSPALASDRASFVWDCPKGQAIHFWRVLTQQTNGWLPSAIASFEGPLCVSDMVMESTAPHEERPNVTLPPGGPGAATALVAEPDCDPLVGEGIARLSWQPAANAGQEQRIIITIYRDGFETGNFDFSARLSPSDTSIVWDRVHGQAIHHWRVITLQSEGWVPSDTASFEGPPCVADWVP